MCRLGYQLCTSRNLWATEGGKGEHNLQCLPVTIKIQNTYLPYKESITLLFVAAYGLYVTTNNNGLEFSRNRRVQLTIKLSYFAIKSILVQRPIRMYICRSIGQIYTPRIQQMLHRLCKHRNDVYQTFKCCDVIWIAMELKRILLCHLWCLISSWLQKLKNGVLQKASCFTVNISRYFEGHCISYTLNSCSYVL